MKLSVIVITKNGEAFIGRCLESVKWADEIVVLDSGSTDRTLEICRALGVNVHQTQDWPGHGPQKNRALDRATGDWILSLDHDEWVTPGLRAEIKRTLAAPERDAYVMPRSSSFCGRHMRHSGWWPDYLPRLWRRGTARFSEDHTHDRVIVEGKTGRLKEPIMHEAVVDLDHVVQKVNSYSSWGAASLHRQGRRASLSTAILHGSWAFVRTYILRLGFLDGREGFMLAVSNAEGTYYRYIKLMLLGRRPPPP